MATAFWIILGFFAFGVAALFIGILADDTRGPHYMAKPVDDEEWQATLDDVRHRNEKSRKPK